MCVVSDKIKLCTCISEDLDVEELNHYWILHRHTKKKDLQILGTPSLPTSMLDENFELNKDKLVTRVNEPDVFDKPLNFHKKDRLELVFNNLSNDYDKIFHYEFEWTGEKWIHVDHEAFHLMNHYNETSSGEIQNK